MMYMSTHMQKLHCLKCYCYLSCYESGNLSNFVLQNCFGYSISHVLSYKFLNQHVSFCKEKIKYIKDCHRNFTESTAWLLV